MSICVFAKCVSHICNSFILKYIKIKTKQLIPYLPWLILLNISIKYGITNCNIIIQQRGWNEEEFLKLSKPI